jgi:hypothetical protein
MADRFRSALALSLAAMLGAGAGCLEPPCAPELHEGTSYRATVVGPYGTGTRFPGPAPFSPGAVPSCGTLDGLGEGGAVTIKATGTSSQGTCELLHGTITAAPPTVMLEKPGAVVGATALLTGAAVVSTGGCHGLWSIQLHRPFEATGTLFDQPVEGMKPPLVMMRRLSVDQENERCRTCLDFLTVKLQQL